MTGPFFDIWKSAFSNGEAHRVLTAWEAKEHFGKSNICFDKLVVGIVGPASPLTLHTQPSPCNASPLVRLYSDFVVRGLRVQQVGRDEARRV